MIAGNGIDRKVRPSVVRLSKVVVKTTVHVARHDWATVGGDVVRLIDVARHARDERPVAIATSRAGCSG